MSELLDALIRERRAQRALFDNLDNDEALALRIDTAIRHTKKDGWVGNYQKEREVAKAIWEELGAYDSEKIGEILEMVKNQDEYR